MKRIIKYSLSILTLLVLALLATPFFLNVEDYRQKIEHEVSDATGRNLHIGHLDASLFPWVGITLSDVRLENREGFSKQDFLQVNKLDIQISLLPLLHKSIEIKRFILQDPHVFLERNAQGQNNWDDLTAQPAVASHARASVASSTTQQTSIVPTSDQKKASPMLAGLTADAMILNNGSLIWNDAQTQQHFSVTAIHVQLDDVQLEHPIQAHLSAKLNQDEVKLDAQFGPLGDITDIDSNHLPIQLHLQSFGLQLAPWASLLPDLPEPLGDIQHAKVRFDMQLEQRPDGARLLAGQLSLLASMQLALDWKMEMPNINSLDVHDVSLQINDKHVLKLQGKIKDITKSLNYQVRLQSDTLQRIWLAKLVPVLHDMYVGHIQAWQSIKVGASLAGTKSHLEIRDLQCELNDEVVQASGDIDFAKAPDIRLRIAGKNLHLAPWLPASAVVPVQDAYATPSSDMSSQAIESASVAKPEQAVEPDLRFLKAWRVALQVQMEHLFVQGLDISHLHTVLNGQKGIFSLEPLQFELAGGSVLETAHLNINTYPAQWNEALNVTGLQLLPVLKAVADIDMLDGTMKLNTNFSAVGLLPESIKHGLEGTAQLSLLNGRVKGFDIAGGLRNIASFGTANPSQSTDFAQLQGSFQAHQGIIKNNDLFMASPLFRLSGKGMVSLPDMTLDYHARPKLIASLIGQGDSSSNRYGIAIPLHIYGAFDELNVKPEITADNVLQEAARLGKKNPQLGKLLKKVDKKPLQKFIDKGITPKQKEQVNRALKGLLGL
ncbi:MAG: AsmA family protein [Mariprofundaceae bacterium]|nr:AsmA family protein [Mariprofundaceae bacterium]